MFIYTAHKGKGQDKYSKKRLQNRLGLQKGLVVFNRFQYQFYKEPLIRTVEDVNYYLYMFYKEIEGYIQDKVPVQLQGSKGGVKEEYQIIDKRRQSEEKNREGKRLGRKGGHIILREEAKLVSLIVVNEEF